MEEGTVKDERTFVTERVFDAPAETVWRAWTEPHLLARWFGPEGTTFDFAEFALEAGGVNHYSADYGRGPQWGKFEYVEVSRPSRLRWRHMFSNPEGELTRHPQMPEWPLVLMTTVELTPRGQQTHLKLTWVPVGATDAERAMFEASMAKSGGGWAMGFRNLDKLFAEGLPEVDFAVAGRLHLRTLPEARLLLTRRFGASPDAVFAAFTEGAQVERWMTGPGDKWTCEAKLDARAGGEGRYVWRTEGTEMGMTCWYDVVEAPSLIEHRELFDQDWTGGETRVTTRFEAAPGGTLVSMTIQYASAEARDRIISTSGMQWGMETGYQKLEALLAG